MRNRKFLIPILLPTIVVSAVALWSILTPGSAIVEAKVNLTAHYGNGFLAQVITTKAFQAGGQGSYFEVWTKCSLSVGQIVDVSVAVSGTLFGSHPTNIEGQLYKTGGLLNTGYVPWDGC